MYLIFASYLRSEMGKAFSRDCQLAIADWRLNPRANSFGDSLSRSVPHDGPAGLSLAARSTLSSEKKQSLVARRWPLAKAVANDQGRTTNDAFNLGAGNSRACSSGG
jgi:hypothetical protein